MPRSLLQFVRFDCTLFDELDEGVLSLDGKTIAPHTDQFGRMRRAPGFRAGFGRAALALGSVWPSVVAKEPQSSRLTREDDLLARAARALLCTDVLSKRFIALVSMQSSSGGHLLGTIAPLCRVRGGVCMFQQHGDSAFHRQILSRICVTPPYLRLQSVEPYGAFGASAWVTFESSPGHEYGPLASAEIGRHLAILGSCALARQRDSSGPHCYYLARAAVLERAPARLKARESYFLVAEPSSESAVNATLYIGREVVATLACSYQVLSGRLFARLFRQHLQADESFFVESPYASPLNLRCEWGEETASGYLGPVLPSMCVGHFSDFPALPVARLMDSIHRLACEHIARHDERPFRLLRCRVGAERLAFAGSELVFRVQRIRRDEGGVAYAGSVEGVEGTELYGEAELDYEFLDADADDAARESGTLPRWSR